MRYPGMNLNDHSFEESNEELYFRVLNGYILLEIVGEGGMGTVYRAIHPQNGKVIALKVSPPLNEKDHLKFIGEKKHFMREIKVMKNLAHPNITRIIDFGFVMDQRQIYLAMDFIEGTDLSFYIEKRTSQDYREVLPLIYEIALAIEYLHHQRIIHRDLKPSNILLDENQKPHITDFGFAKIRDRGASTITDSDQIIGTLAHMAPEQMKQNILGPPTFATDVYALGVIFFELFTGEKPFKGSPMDVVVQKFRSRPPHAHTLYPDLPQELGDLCFNMLQLYPHKRCSSSEVREFIENLI